MAELKRCRHCGGEAEYRSHFHYGGEVWVECKRCGIRTKEYRVPGPGKSEELAKMAWEREAKNEAGS